MLRLCSVAGVRNSRRFLLAIGLAVTLVGGGLLSLTAYGQTVGAVTYPSSGSIPGYNLATSDTQTVKDALRNGIGRDNDAYGQALVALVYSGLVHGDHTQLHWFQNWVLAIAARLHTSSWTYTQDPERIADAGVAICSQNAAVIVGIARQDNVPARVVAFDGHVLAEIVNPVNGAWEVVDGDYGVHFPFGADSLGLDVNREAVGEALRSNGFGEASIDEYLRIVSTSIPVYREIWTPNDSKPWRIEKVTGILSWLFPIVLVMIGIGLLSFGLRRKDRPHHR